MIADFLRRLEPFHTLHPCDRVNGLLFWLVRCSDLGHVTAVPFPDGVVGQTQYRDAMKAFVAYADAYQLLPSLTLLTELTGIWHMGASP